MLKHLKLSVSQIRSHQQNPTPRCQGELYWSYPFVQVRPIGAKIRDVSGDQVLSSGTHYYIFNWQSFGSGSHGSYVYLGVSYPNDSGQFIINPWHILGKTLLKVKLLVGPTCKIPRSTQRGFWE